MPGPWQRTNGIRTSRETSSLSRTVSTGWTLSSWPRTRTSPTCRRSSGYGPRTLAVLRPCYSSSMPLRTPAGAVQQRAGWSVPRPRTSQTSRRQPSQPCPPRAAPSTIKQRRETLRWGSLAKTPHPSRLPECFASSKQAPSMQGSSVKWKPGQPAWPVAGSPAAQLGH